MRSTPPFERSGSSGSIRPLPMVLLLAFFFVLVPQLEGQVRIIPSIGLYAPLSDLGEVRDETGATLVEAGRRSSTLALGGALEVGPARGFASLRGEVMYATASDVPLEIVGCPNCELRSTMLSGTALLVLRPILADSPMQPYFLAGAGVQRHNFDWRDVPGEGVRDYFEGQTRPSLQMGAGAQLSLGVIQPRLELNAQFSSVEAGTSRRELLGSEDRQTSLFLTLSVPLGG
jgi:hypothetical protein